MPCRAVLSLCGQETTSCTPLDRQGALLPSTLIHGDDLPPPARCSQHRVTGPGTPSMNSSYGMLCAYVYNASSSHVSLDTDSLGSDCRPCAALPHLDTPHHFFIICTYRTSFVRKSNEMHMQLMQLQLQVMRSMMVPLQLSCPTKLQETAISCMQVRW